MQLTRTFGPNALARPSVRVLSPALAAAYGRYSGSGRIAAIEETLMIAPPSPAAIFVPTSAASRNGPLRLIASTLSKSASSMASRLGYSGDRPALLTSTSTRPKSL